LAAKPHSWASPGGAADPPSIHEIALVFFDPGALPAALGRGGRTVANPDAEAFALALEESCIITVTETFRDA
jgi:hypothetical protein